MMTYRAIVRHAFTLILALSLNACWLDPTIDESANASVSLTITSPSNASAMDTTDAVVSLAGNASSEIGILRVSWTNDRGGEGIASGTDSWQVANIDLVLGPNNITVAAEDAAGAIASRSIVVNRESGGTGSASLSWVAPTSRTDGSALTNLAGYKIYYGRMSGIYDYQIGLSNPGLSSYDVENLVPGDWYFALAAYDSAGVESDRSNEVLRDIS